MADTQPPESSWSIENGNDIRRQATRAIGQGLYLHELGDPSAEEVARSALALAASATYWLEDTELEDDAHRELDKYGKWIRETFPDGCALHWTGRGYEHRCPVRIAHKRIGFSIGFVTAKRTCSICGGDLSECEHLPGESYEVSGGPGPEGYCRVCLKKNCREHQPDQVYRARAACHITEIDRLEEVSLVSRPRHPDARLVAIPIDSKDLVARLGPNFHLGMHVQCNQCLDPCTGFEKVDLPHPTDVGEKGVW